jgi:hypothetical protein
MVRGIGSILVSLLAFSVAACGASAASVDDGADRDDRFVGLWAVDNGLDHLWRSSLYDLQPDGTLAHLGDAAFVAGEELEVGVLSPPPGDEACLSTGAGCEDGVQCAFGDAWWSEGPEVLWVLVDCDDGATRRARLDFEGTPAEDAEGVRAEVHAVDGARGWSLVYETAVFRRCDTASACLPSDE